MDKEKVMNEQKSTVKALKESIEKRREFEINQKRLISYFKSDIISYFKAKYGLNVRVLTFGDTFGVEKDLSIYRQSHIRYGNGLDFTEALSFSFGIDVLHDFCKTFECDFVETVGESRYIFTFSDVDMKGAFL